MRCRICAAAVMVWLVVGASSPAHAQVKKPAGRSPAAATASNAISGPVAGADYAARFRAVCAACHGADGRSDMPGTPVLAGQPALYAITQLFLFREGRRHNDAMIALAKTMTDADLRGYSDHIGTLPPVPAPTPATLPDPVRMSKGQALAAQHRCTFCHGSDLAGGQQVPRIGGQKEEYMRQTLQGFKTGDRPGYTRAMTEALSQVSMEDLDLLAYYAANFTGK